MELICGVVVCVDISLSRVRYQCYYFSSFGLWWWTCWTCCVCFVSYLLNCYTFADWIKDFLESTFITLYGGICFERITLICFTKCSIFFLQYFAEKSPTDIMVVLVLPSCSIKWKCQLAAYSFILHVSWIASLIIVMFNHLNKIYLGSPITPKCNKYTLSFISSTSTSTALILWAAKNAETTSS